MGHLMRKERAAALVLVGPFVAGALAGPIETISFYDSRSYTSGQFDTVPPGNILWEAFMLPRFDPSMGQLQEVTITVGLLSGGFSVSRMDNEAPHSDGTHMFAGGYIMTNIPFANEMSGWVPMGMGALLYGSTSGIVDLTEDTDPGGPDFVGTDAATHSGMLLSPKYESATTTPLPGFPGPGNENPAFIGFIEEDGLNFIEMPFYVASAMVSPIHENIERQFSNSNVSVQAEVRYTYEVPGPGAVSLALLSLTALSGSRRRRA